MKDNFVIADAAYLFAFVKPVKGRWKMVDDLYPRRKE
jgi:hypothetical protein